MYSTVMSFSCVRLALTSKHSYKYNSGSDVRKLIQLHLHSHPITVSSVACSRTDPRTHMTRNLSIKSNAVCFPTKEK